MFCEKLGNRAIKKEVIKVAYLKKAEDSLFSPVRLDKELYDKLFERTREKAKGFQRKITGNIIRENIVGKEGVVFFGSLNKIALTVEVITIDLENKKATVCLAFPIIGKAKDQREFLLAIKFQIKINGFFVNHCGLETEISLEGLNVQEVRQNYPGGYAQRYYKIKK